MEIIKQSKALIAWQLSRMITPLSADIAGCLASKVWFTPIGYKGTKKSPMLLRPEYFYIDGLRFSSYFPENAESGTVILIHGWGGSSSQFDDLKSALLKAKRKVVSFDFPAHGKSPGLSTDLHEMKVIVEKLLTRIDGPVQIVCHSFGLLVVGHQLQNPEIKKIVTISSPHKFDFLLDSFMRKTKLPEKIKPALINHIQKRVMNKLDVRKDIDLKSFNIKTLMIHDENDREIPVQEFHALKILNPDAETLLTRGLGHNRILANSHVINSVVSFLGKTPSH